MMDQKQETLSSGLETDQLIGACPGLREQEALDSTPVSCQLGMVLSICSPRRWGQGAQKFEFMLSYTGSSNSAKNA